MFKVIKWTLIGTVTLGVTAFFLLGQHTGSYVRTIGNSVRESVRGSIPVEFEIRRAEKLIREIDPELLECCRDVATAQVELEELERNVSRLEEAVAAQESKLKRGVDSLGDAETTSYWVGEASYPRHRVESDLARTLDLYKNNTAMLKSKRALIERQSMAVSASLAKLDSVRNRKAELEHSIAALKVQKKQLDAMAATSLRYNLDDSTLSQAEEVLRQVKKRLDISQKMIEDDIFFTESATLPSTPARDIVTEIKVQFSEKVEPAKKALSVRGTNNGYDR